MALCLRGTGMYMTTDCTPMYSLPIQTVYGGTGAGLPDSMVLAGDSAGDGLLRGIIAVGILLTGMVATGVAIGATIITITIIIRITSVSVGVVATGEVVMDGMAQADVIREYMPEDTPTAIALHAQAAIIM